jgi:hypothetical protein
MSRRGGGRAPLLEVHMAANPPLFAHWVGSGHRSQWVLHAVNLWSPGPLLATAWAYCVSGGSLCARAAPLIPLLIAGRRFFMGRASSFLLTASNSICSPCITGPYNMHATALSALIDWGRVHEVRRAQPKLSGSLIQFGISPFCRWNSRGALLTGSFTRFWRFTIEQPYKVFPVVGRLSGLSARRSPVEAMRSVDCCAGC